MNPLAMSAKEFQRIFGARKLGTYETSTKSQVSHPKPQQNQEAALGSAVSGEAGCIRRTVVRFTGRRVKPLDPDNFAGSVKDLLDGLRHSGLIHGDEWWRIKLETEQVKVAHYYEEETIIEIETL